MGSKPLRLSDVLVKKAIDARSFSRRSAPQQIEYWAEVGLKTEKYLTVEQIRALLDDEVAGVSVIQNEASDFSVDDLFTLVEQKRELGQLTSESLPGNIWYRSSKEHKGYLEQVSRNGEVVVGKLENGEFVEKEKICG